MNVIPKPFLRLLAAVLVAATAIVLTVSHVAAETYTYGNTTAEYEVVFDEEQCQIRATGTLQNPNSTYGEATLVVTDAEGNSFTDFVEYDQEGPYPFDLQIAFAVEPAEAIDVELWAWDNDSRGARLYAEYYYQDFDCLPVSFGGEWTLEVARLSDARPEAAVPASDGRLACGIFDLQGLGAKHADLTQYPNCPGVVDILCMSYDGQWVDQDIKDVTLTGSIIQFRSMRSGLCGFFPALE
jgi:hypothetical protein